MRTDPFKKIISAVLTAALLLLDIPADIFAGRTASDVRAENSSKASPKVKIKIPDGMGTVLEKFSGEKPFFVVLLQDIHCVTSAQIHLAEISDLLHEKYKISLAALEGASGKVNPSFLYFLPDPKIKRDVLNTLLREGMITGIEHLVASKNISLQLWGVENRDLYLKNLDSYRRAQGLDVSRALKHIRTNIQSSKKEKLPKLVYDMDKLYWQYRRDPRYLEALLTKIVKAPGFQKKSFPLHMGIYRRLAALDKKLDREALQKEIVQLTEELTHRKSKEQIAKIIKLSLHLRLGKISEFEYFTALSRQSRQTGISMKRFPLFMKYLRLLKLKSSVSIDKMNEEIRDFIKSIFPNELVFLWNDTLLYAVLADLLSLELSYADWRTFSHFAEKEKQIWFKRYGPRHSERLLKKKLKVCEDFYQAAVKRNEILSQNMFEKMGKEKVSSSLLIAGGFHKDGILEILRKHGISYSVLAPRIEAASSSPYRQLLLGQLSPIDKVLLQNALSDSDLFKAALVPALKTADSPLTDLRLRVMLLKKAALFYTLLDLWENGQKTPETIRDELKKSFAKNLAAVEKKELEEFLDSLHIGRMPDSEKNEIWLQVTLAGRQMIFIIGDDLNDSGHSISQPVETGLLSFAKNVSYKIFHAENTVQSRPEKMPFSWSLFISKLRSTFLNRFTLAGLAGIGTSFAAIHLFTYATFLNPEYVFGRDFLSDLGESQYSWPFNLSTIVAGGFLAWFGWISLKPILQPSVRTRIGLAALSISGVFLMLVGIFPSSLGLIHIAVAGGFFIAISAGLLLLYKSMALSPVLGLPVAVAAVLASTLSIAFVITMDPGIETAAAFSHLIGILITSWQLLKYGLRTWPGNIQIPAGQNMPPTITETSGSRSETTVETIVSRTLEEEKFDPLTDKPEEVAEKSMEKLIESTAFSRDTATAKWPHAVQELKEALTHWLSGQKPLARIPEDFSEAAIQEMNDMAKAYSHAEKYPYLAVFARLTDMASDELRHGGTDLVRPPDLGLRILNLTQPELWVYFLLGLDFQYDYPVFSRLIEKQSSKLARSVEASIGEERMPRVLLGYFMKSGFSAERSAEFAGQLSVQALEILFNEIFFGKSLLGGSSKLRELGTNWLPVVAEKSGQNPYQVLISQARSILTLDINRKNWLTWVAQIIPRLPPHDSHAEALLQEMERLDKITSVESLKSLLNTIIPALKKPPVTGAVALKPSDKEIQQIAEARIIGRHINIEGLSSDHYDWLNFKTRNILAQFPDFDFSDVVIRIVEGAGRLAQTEGKTITLDAKIFQSRALFNLELAHEFLELVASRAKLGFAKPAIRESIMLLMEVYEYRDLSPVSKVDVLEVLLRSADMDQGKFALFLYSSLSPAERQQIRPLLDKKISASQKAILDQTPDRSNDTDIINTSLDYLEQDIYSPAIQMYVQQNRSSMVKKIQEELAQFLLHLKSLQTLSLLTFLGRAAKERFPNASASKIKSWIQIDQQEIAKQEKRDKSMLVKTAFIITGTAFGFLILLQAAALIGANLILSLAAAAVIGLLFIYLSAQATMNLWSDFKAFRERWNPVSFDAKSKTIHIHPLGYPKRIAKGFQQALIKLEKELGKSYRDILRYAVEKQPDAIVFTDLPPFQEPVAANEWRFSDQIFLIRMDDETVWGYDIRENQFMAIETKETAKSLRILNDDEKAKLSGIIASIAEISDIPAVKALKEGLPSVKQGSPTLRRAWTRSPAVLAKGTMRQREFSFEPSAMPLSKAKDWEQDLNGVLSLFMKSFPAVRWDEIQIQVVRGNDRLAHFDERGTRKTITLDADAFKSNALLKLELTHELIHVIMRDIPRKVPQAIEEIIVIRYMTDVFHDLAPEEQEEILRALRNDPDLDDQSSWKLYFMRLGPRSRQELMKRFEKDPDILKELESIERYTLRGLDEAIIDYATKQDDSGRGTYAPIIQEYLTLKLDESTRRKIPRDRADLLKELDAFRIPVKEIFTITDDIKNLILHLKEQKDFTELRWQLLRKTSFLLQKLFKIYGPQARNLSIRVANAAITNIRRLDDAKAIPYLLREYFKIAQHFDDLPRDADIHEFLDNFKWLADHLPDGRKDEKLKAYVKISEIHFERAKFKDANETSLTGLKIFPDSIELHIIAGDTFRSQGEEDKALKYYRKALQINPHHPVPHERLGNFYAEKRDFELSYAHQRKARYLSRRMDYHFEIPFENLKQAGEALTKTMAEKPGQSKEIIGTWVQAVLDDGLFKDEEDMPDLKTLKEHKALLAQDLLSRHKSLIQAEFEWVNNLLKELGSQVDSSFSVQFNTPQEEWTTLRKNVRRIFEDRKMTPPADLVQLSQNPQGWEIFSAILKMGGPGITIHEPGLSARKKIFERLSEGYAKITRITETVDAKEALKDAVPNWVRILIPGMTSPFKVRQPAASRVSIVSRGRYLFGQFRFFGISNPNLINALRKVFAMFPQKSLNLRRISIRIVRDYDRLARIDLTSHVLYVDERLLDYPELLNLELVEEFSHIVIHQHQDMFQPVINPAFEEIAALALKIDYFKGLDPLEQAKILIDLVQHPEWDLGNFVSILASALTARRQLAVLYAMQSYFGANAPAALFTHDAENTDIDQSLVSYLLSADSESSPLYPEEVTNTLTLKHSIANAGYMTQAARGLFKRQDIQFFANSPSSSHFREFFLTEADSKMDYLEREMFLFNAFLSAFSDFPDNPPTQRDWLRAYIQFVLPYVPISSEVKDAAYRYLGEMDENTPQIDIAAEWYQWVHQLNVLSGKAPQEGMALMRVLDLSSIFSDAVLRAGHASPISQQWMLAKVIEFLQHHFERLIADRFYKMSDSERNIIDAFNLALLRADHEQLLGAFAHLGKHPSEFYPVTQIMQRFSIGRTGDLQNLVRRLAFLKLGRQYGITVRRSKDVPDQFFLRWLSPIIADPSFAASLDLDVSRMKTVYVEPLADVLKDRSSQWNQGRKDLPFLLTFQMGEEEISVIVILNRELDSAKLSSNPFMNLQMDVGDFWMNEIKYSAYHVSTYLTSSPLTLPDRRRLMKFIAEKLVNRLAKLAGQILDYQYYAGRLERFGDNAFEPLEKISQSRTLFEAVLALSPARFEEVKRRILDDLIEREIGRLDPFLAEGMTREGLKMAGNYQIGEMLPVLNFSPEQSFEKMREQATLAYIYQQFMKAWEHTSGLPDKDALNLFDYQTDFETEYVSRLWNLGSDQAQPVIERLIALADPELTVQILPSIAYTDEKPEGVVYHSSIQKVLIDRKSWIRNPMFLIHLARIPERIWREVLPHLHDWQVERLHHAGRLLEQLDYVEDGQRLMRIGQRAPKFVSFARTVYDFINRRLPDWTLNPYERLSKNVSNLAAAWQIRLREAAPMSPQIWTYLTLNSLESFLYVQGYELARLVLAKNGMRMYEARSTDGMPVWITLAAGHSVTADPSKETLLPVGLLVTAEDIYPDVGGAPAQPSRFEVWNAQPLEEWLKMGMTRLNLVKSNLQLLHDMLDLIQTPPKINPLSVFPKFWVSSSGRLALHPSLFWGKTDAAGTDWQNELLHQVRQVAKSLVQYMPPLVRASMKHSDNAPAHFMVHKMIDQQIRQLETLLQAQAPDLDTLMQVVRQLMSFWREFENLSQKPLRLLPAAGPSQPDDTRRTLDQAA